MEHAAHDEARLKDAIDRLITAIREERSGAGEAAALTTLVSQLRAANEHLVPRLDALKKYPPLRMVLKQQPASGTSWQTLEWQEAAR